MKKITFFVKKNKVILIILLSVFLLRLFFLSPWLEDWDSVQFSLGLHKFNILKQQPHPPGYFLYIQMGRIFLYFLKTDVLALTTLSCVFGTLSIIVTYFLAKTMFNTRVALLSALFLSILPVHWVLSEIAISNMPGLFFMTLLILLAYRDLKLNTNISFLGLVSGLALGVRATDAPIVIGLLFFCVLKKRNLKYFFYLTLGLLAGVCLWFIPVIKITGLQEFRAANSATANYVIWHDMLSGKPFSLFNYLYIRITNLIKLLGIGYSYPFILLFLLSLKKVLSLKKIRRNLSCQILSVYFLAYGIPLVFLYNQELAQYTLPLAPVVVIIVALFIDQLWKNPMIKVVVTGIAGYLFVISLGEVNYQRLTAPPTIEPVNYTRENFKPEETTLVTTFTYRQFQYYAPGFRNYYGVSNTPRNISTKYVVTDYQPLKNQIPALAHYVQIGEQHFGTSLNPFVRLRQTNIYILKNTTPTP